MKFKKDNSGNQALPADYLSRGWKPMLTRWPADLFTGIRALDLQHKKLDELMEQLGEEIGKPQPHTKMVGETVIALIEQTYNHFLTEEELFQRVHYPKAAEHVAEHNAFTRSLLDVLNRHEQGERLSPREVDALKHWLIDHIRKMDRPYVPFLISTNLR